MRNRQISAILWSEDSKTSKPPPLTKVSAFILKMDPKKFYVKTISFHQVSISILKVD